MPWIDVDDVKAHLNKAANVTTDDAELQRFINGACSQIEDLMGHVDLVTIAETQTPNCRGYVVLDERPLLDVTSIEQVLSDGTTVPVLPADPVAGVDGYSLPGGRMVLLPGTGVHVITYRAGRNPVPGNYIQAALDLVQHHWRKSQLNAGAGRRPRGNAYVGDSEGVLIPGLASALPYAVREQLGLLGKHPRSEVLFA